MDRRSARTRWLGNQRGAVRYRARRFAPTRGGPSPCSSSGAGAASASDATWAAFRTPTTTPRPYLSPFYSPCFSTTCQHVDAAARGVVVEPVAGVPHPVGAGRVPRHLLLLPEGLLPLLLRIASGLRRERLGEDATAARRASVRPAEHPPLLLLALLIILAFLWYDVLLAFKLRRSIRGGRRDGRAAGERHGSSRSTPSPATRCRSPLRRAYSTCSRRPRASTTSGRRSAC